MTTVDLIVRGCCETEPADPDHQDTICISVDALRGILEGHLAAKPDGRLHADGYFTWLSGKRPAYLRDQGLPCDFYLAAPREPCPNADQCNVEGQCVNGCALRGWHTPARQATLPEHIDRIAAVFGSLRKMSEALEIDVGYLSRLRSGEKSDPSDEVLATLGLRKTVTYTRTHSGTYEPTPLIPRTRSA